MDQLENRWSRGTKHDELEEESTGIHQPQDELVREQVRLLHPHEDVLPQGRRVQVGKDQAIEEGKPEEMAEKIAQGRLNKFFKENTLLSQSFIKDNKKSVEQYLKEQNSDLTVTEFKRISLG